MRAYMMSSQRSQLMEEGCEPRCTTARRGRAGSQELEPEVEGSDMLAVAAVLMLPCGQPKGFGKERIGVGGVCPLGSQRSAKLVVHLNYHNRHFMFPLVMMFQRRDGKRTTAVGHRRRRCHAARLQNAAPRTHIGSERVKLCTNFSLHAGSRRELLRGIDVF